jgi:hypothetical protein
MPYRSSQYLTLGYLERRIRRSPGKASTVEGARRRLAGRPELRFKASPLLHVTWSFPHAIGARARVRPMCLLPYIHLKRYKRMQYQYPMIPTRLSFGLPPTSFAAFLRPPSLVSSHSFSSLLPEAGRATTRRPGLHRSLHLSATHVLGIERHGSILCFFAEVGSPVNTSRPPDFHDSFFLATLQVSLRLFPTSYQGAFLCCLKTITTLER